MDVKELFGKTVFDSDMVEIGKIESVILDKWNVSNLLVKIDKKFRKEGGKALIPTEKVSKIGTVISLSEPGDSAIKLKPEED